MATIPVRAATADPGALTFALRLTGPFTDAVGQGLEDVVADWYNARSTPAGTTPLHSWSGVDVDQTADGVTATWWVDMGYAGYEVLEALVGDLGAWVDTVPVEAVELVVGDDDASL